VVLMGNFFPRAHTPRIDERGVHIRLQPRRVIEGIGASPLSSMHHNENQYYHEKLSN
jgi:hypothetical protein